MNDDCFSLDEGQVILRWPPEMSPESYEDLKDWLELMIRRMKRVVKPEAGGSKYMHDTLNASGVHDGTTTD